MFILRNTNLISRNINNKINLQESIQLNEVTNSIHDFTEAILCSDLLRHWCMTFDAIYVSSISVNQLMSWYVRICHITFVTCVHQWRHQDTKCIFIQIRIYYTCLQKCLKVQTLSSATCRLSVYVQVPNYCPTSGIPLMQNSCFANPWRMHVIDNLDTI